MAVVPLILATTTHPENTIMSANNSVVISAACHCSPVRPATKPEDVSPMESPLKSAATSDASDIEDRTEKSRILQDMATGKLKWGVVSRGANTPDSPGHLSFGTEEQSVAAPVHGDWYAG
jgi:hypothetical protein